MLGRPGAIGCCCRCHVVQRLRFGASVSGVFAGIVPPPKKRYIPTTVLPMDLNDLNVSLEQGPFEVQIFLFLENKDKETSFLN